MAVANYMNQPTVKPPKPFGGGGSQGGTASGGGSVLGGGAGKGLGGVTTPTITPAPGQQGLVKTGNTAPGAGQPRTGTPLAANNGGGSTYDTGMGMVQGPRSQPPPNIPPPPTQPQQPPQYGTNPVGPSGQPAINQLQPWSPVPFSQTPYANVQPGQQANPGGAFSQYLGNDPNLFKPDAYKDNDGMTPNYLSQMLPLWQLQQNASQYAGDFNEASRRYDQDYLRQAQNDIFQQQLSTQQQNAAQWQANTAADQWNRQFAQTQQTDQWGNEIANRQLGLQGQEIQNTGQYQQGLVNNQATQNANQLKVGLDQNQASRDVAGIYGQSNMYQANQQLAGQKYQADQGLAQAGLYAGAQNYGAQLGLQGQLGSAGMYSDAQKYQAQLGLQGQQYQSNQQLAGQLGSANIYGNAQMYQADQGLAGQQVQANAQMGSAGLYSGAQKYQADQGLQGQLGSAGIYGNAQMYGANQQLAGTKYESNTQKQIAAQQNQFLYSQLQQQSQQAQLERENQLAMTNAQVYGRSQAPRTNWARSWS